MQNEMNLNTCLQAWNDVYFDDPAFEGDHLASDMLYRMAGPGGIYGSSQYEVEHLSLCPKCLDEWASWRRALSVIEESDQGLEDDYTFMSYGILKAAATKGLKDPISVLSECGRFTLGIFPQIDDPAKAMITLEIAENDTTLFEDRTTVVKDRNGLLLLKGKVQNGRLARRFEDLNKVDFSTWTVVVE